MNKKLLLILMLSASLLALLALVVRIGISDCNRGRFKIGCKRKKFF